MRSYAAVPAARCARRCVPRCARTAGPVLLYTDGVTETVGDTDRFGTGRLRQLLSKHAHTSPAQLLAALDETLEEFRRGPASDDVAALALRPLTGTR